MFLSNAAPADLSEYRPRGFVLVQAGGTLTPQCRPGSQGAATFRGRGGPSLASGCRGVPSPGGTWSTSFESCCPSRSSGEGVEKTALLCKPAAHWRRSVGLACKDQDAVDEVPHPALADEVAHSVLRRNVVCESAEDQVPLFCDSPTTELDLTKWRLTEMSLTAMVTCTK